jgi:hypothetical protein
MNDFCWIWKSPPYSMSAPGGSLTSAGKRRRISSIADPRSRSSSLAVTAAMFGKFSRRIS